MSRIEEAVFEISECLDEENPELNGC